MPTLENYASMIKGYILQEDLDRAYAILEEYEVD